MSILLVIALLRFSVLFAKEDIKGVWLNPERTRSIRIYEHEGKFFGIMHWIGAPDPKLKTGQIILKGLVYKDGQFKNGQAFTPGYGWVSCEAKLTQGRLHLTGHLLGISRTRIFSRTE
ncbi:MAG: DUF2147 domain-containing protein [Niabella sp.]